MRVCVGGGFSSVVFSTLTLTAVQECDCRSEPTHSPGPPMQPSQKNQIQSIIQKQEGCKRENTVCTVIKSHTQCAAERYKAQTSAELHTWPHTLCVLWSNGCRYVMGTQCREYSTALIVVDTHCGVALQTPYRLGAREYVLAHCPESKRGGASASSCQQVWVAFGGSCSRWWGGGGGGGRIEHQ